MIVYNQHLGNMKMYLIIFDRFETIYYIDIPSYKRIINNLTQIITTIYHNTRMTVDFQPTIKYSDVNWNESAGRYLLTYLLTSTYFRMTRTATTADSCTFSRRDFDRRTAAYRNSPAVIIQQTNVHQNKRNVREKCLVGIRRISLHVTERQCYSVTRYDYGIGGRLQCNDETWRRTRRT